MFTIDAYDLHWLEGLDERDDLCLHGHAVATIGGKEISYESVTVSATALFLLKSLTQNREEFLSNQMLPCCGFYIIAEKDKEDVYISGCPNGEDWDIRHDGDNVILTAMDGTQEIVPIEKYKQEVFRFADKIEDFYKKSKPKHLPKENDLRDGYLTFWKEWHRRRCE